VSAVAERSPTETTICPNCGARLAGDQDWCLECGAAVKVRIRPAPGWRAPVAIVGGVVVVSALILVLALSALSSSANSSVPAVLATPPVHHARHHAAAAAKTQAAAKTPAATRPAATIASWPAGVTGYTVVLAVIPTKPAATASATKIASAGIPVGVLSSSDYSSMRPGDWIVFSGTYSSRAQADAAATGLQTKGQTGAYGFPVVPAG
jgi:hypothetical protein